MTTNFLLFRVERDRGEFLEALASRGVWMVGYPHQQVRAVPHYGVTRADIDTTIAAVAGALRDTRRRPAASSDELPTTTEPSGPTSLEPEAARPRVAVAH